MYEKLDKAVKSKGRKKQAARRVHPSRGFSFPGSVGPPGRGHRPLPVKAQARVRCGGSEIKAQQLFGGTSNGLVCCWPNRADLPAFGNLGRAVLRRSHRSFGGRAVSTVLGPSWFGNVDSDPADVRA